MFGSITTARPENYSKTLHQRIKRGLESRQKCDSSRFHRGAVYVYVERSNPERPNYALPPSSDGGPSFLGQQVWHDEITGDLARNAHQEFSEILSAQEADEGPWSVLKSLNHIFAIFDTPLADRPALKMRKHPRR